MLRKHKKILTNISLSLISIFLFLLFFEITVRLLNISSGYDYPTGLYQEDELLGYSMAPNLKRIYQLILMDYGTLSILTRKIKNLGF